MENEEEDHHEMDGFDSEEEIKEEAEEEEEPVDCKQEIKEEKEEDVKNERASPRSRRSRRSTRRVCTCNALGVEYPLIGWRAESEMPAVGQKQARGAR